MKTIEPDEEPAAAERDDDRNKVRPGLAFDDDYWDEAFNTLYEPSMRVCSVYGCC